MPYLSKNGDFSLFQKLSIPTLAIIGDCDQGLCRENVVDCMEKLKENNKFFDYKIIQGAKHNFKNFEQEVAKSVVKYIK